MEELQVEKLPLDWPEFPYPRSTQEIGDQWLESAASVGLIVPSVAAPLQLEKIAVLNALHPDIRFLKLINSTNQLYSDRAFKRR